MSEEKKPFGETPWWVVAVAVAAALGFLLIFVGCAPAPQPKPSGVPKVTIPKEELDHQRAKDVQTIAALANAGSDLSKPHRLEHHFLCATRAEADPVIAWGIANGYEASPVTDGEFEGRRYAYFDLIKETVPTIANITSETTAMLETATRHGIDYDGWGCTIVK